MGQPSPVTIRAWTMEMDGEPVAFAGIWKFGGETLVFSQIRPGAAIPKTAIWRAAKLLMAKLSGPALAQSEGSSGRFLERLGWERTEREGVYRWQHSSPQ